MRRWGHVPYRSLKDMCRRQHVPQRSHKDMRRRQHVPQRSHKDMIPQNDVLQRSLGDMRRFWKGHKKSSKVTRALLLLLCLFENSCLD